MFQYLLLISLILILFAGYIYRDKVESFLRKYYKKIVTLFVSGGLVAGGGLYFDSIDDTVSLGWTNPTSAWEVGVVWTNEDNIIDGDTGTMGRLTSTNTGAYVYLNYSGGLNTDSVRLYGAETNRGSIVGDGQDVTVSYLSGGSWTEIWDNQTLPRSDNNGYETISFGDTYSITSVRITSYTITVGNEFSLYVVQYNEVASNNAPIYSSQGTTEPGVYKDGENTSHYPVLSVAWTDSDSPAASSMNISYYNASDNSLLGYNDTCTVDKGVYYGKIQLLDLNLSDNLEYYAICNDSEDETQSDNFWCNVTDSLHESQIFYFDDPPSNGGHDANTYTRGMNTTKPSTENYSWSTSDTVYYYVDNETSCSGNKSIDRIYYHIWVSSSDEVEISFFCGLYDKGADGAWSNGYEWSDVKQLSDNVSEREISGSPATDDTYRLYTGYVENMSSVIDGDTDNSYYYTYLSISSTDAYVVGDVPTNTSYDNSSFVIMNPTNDDDTSTDTDDDGYSDYDEMFTYYSDPFTANATSQNTNSPTYEGVTHQGYDLTNENTSINPVLYVIFDDDDEQDVSDFTAYFYDNSDDSLIGVDTIAVNDKSIDGTDMYGFKIQWVGLQPGTTYTYYVSVNDSIHNTTSSDITFTTSNIKHPYEIFYMHPTNGSYGQTQSGGSFQADYHIMNNTLPTVEGASGCSNFYLYYFEDDDSMYNQWSYVDDIYIHVWRARNESQYDEDTYQNKLFSEIGGSQMSAWINGSEGYLYENTTSLAAHTWENPTYSEGWEDASEYYELYCHDLKNTGLMLDGTNQSNYFNSSIHFNMEDNRPSYPTGKINLFSNTSYDNGSFIILNPPDNLDEIDTDNDGYTDYEELYIYYSNPFLSNSSALIFEETIRTDGEDYFVWLGDNCTLDDVADNISGFDEASETISILGNNGHWINLSGTGSSAENVYTFDVIKVVLDDGAGNITVNMTENSDYSNNYENRTFTLVDVGNGYNYTGFSNGNGSTLGAEADEISMITGEFIGVWNDTSYSWSWHIQGFNLNNNVNIGLWDVCQTKITANRTWNQG
jgi:hypothetical protein